MLAALAAWCASAALLNALRHGMHPLHSSLHCCTAFARCTAHCTAARPALAAPQGVRQDLYDELVKIHPEKDWTFVLKQIGMFSFTGLTPTQASSLGLGLPVHVGQPSPGVQRHGVGQLRVR